MNKIIAGLFFVSLVYAVCFAAPSDTAQQTGLTVSGLSQNDFILLQTLDQNKPLRDQFGCAGVNLLTLNVQTPKSTAVKIEASSDFYLISGGYAQAVGRSSSYTLVAQADSSAAFILDIRKLYAAVMFPWADFSLGRQIISFGEGMVFSPIDVFSSVNVLDLAFKRHGSDVARVRVPLGDVSGLDAVAKLAENPQTSATAIKAYSHAGSFDIAGIGIYQGEQNEAICGLTFKGDLVAGVYGELVEHLMFSGNHAFTGMAGADYSIQNTWYFTAEYLYNQQAQANTGQAQLSPLQTNILLVHHHYGFVNARFVINDLMNVSAGAIADISAGSGILTGQYFYNFLQNADAILYLQYYPAATDGLLQLPVGIISYGTRLEVAF
ncbi:MAG: hypothetical protein PHC61_16115 [Chitinivibrionales bacterium]|nr:hypothetical protein [Chitinivibrionales bacterium]